MISSQRVIFSDNGTLIDYSYELSDFRATSVSIPYVAGEDYLYIATELPFNNKYIDMDTANDQASSVSVDIWFGNEWVPAVDIIDRTKLSGASLGQDGHIIFNTNDQKGWDLEDDSSDIAGLGNTAIYNMYWTRLSFDTDFNIGSTVNYIGQKFADDDRMYDYYPDLNNSALKLAFEAGKTTWDVQHFLAAQNILRDLKRSGIVISRDQILDHQIWEDAAIHKAAIIIFAGLGRAYFDNLQEAKNAYNEAIRVRLPNIDKDKDGKLSPFDKRYTTGELSR